MAGYAFFASPTLYAGQTITAGLFADAYNDQVVTVRLYIRTYGDGDRLYRRYGPETTLTPGQRADLAWRVPDTSGSPIAEVGVTVTSPGTVYLDFLTWHGTPDITLTRPSAEQTMWRRAWVDAVDHFDAGWPEAYRAIQDEGRGMVAQGTSDWQDYRASAQIGTTLAQAIGLAVRVQGLRRYYALLLDRDAGARLVKMLDTEHVLAEIDYAWDFDTPYQIALEICGSQLRAWINQALIFDLDDKEQPFGGGGVALICENGCLSTDAVHVVPVSREKESKA
jgi:hypothetical protein